MTDQDDTQLETLRQLAAGVISGTVDPATIPSGWDFIKIQNAIQKMGRMTVVKRMMAVSRARLERKGFVELEGMGWKHKDDLAGLHLVKKGERWFVRDPRKTTPKSDTTKTTAKSGA